MAIDRDAAVQIAQDKKEEFDRRFLGNVGDEPTDVDFDLLSLCDYVLFHEVDLNRVLGVKATRIVQYAKDVKELGDADGVLTAGVAKMASFGYDIAEMILGLNQKEELDVLEP